ncbi:putative leucine-rich repeat domain superfamily, F-box-like domain superfamily [Helianthus debilis subsp. tardiflorus]
MKPEYLGKAERLSSDIISTLPHTVLEMILCLLPTDEAARTSILSTEWRYKWTRIPNLEFNLRKRTSKPTSDIASVMKYMDMHDLHQVLLLRQGPIHELTLVMDGYWREDYGLFEFNQIRLLLLRNHTDTIKKLRLHAWDSTWNELPISVFALHHLTDLSLRNFSIELPSIFNGFGSLGSLELSDVEISTQTLRRLLSNCSSLKSLSLYIGYSDDKCTIYEILKCLPLIEDLIISSDACEWLLLDSVLQELPTSLIHLKLLSLERMSFVEGSRLAFLLALIKCSPNLERLELEMAWGSNGSAVKDEYSDVWLEHLKELHICFPGNSDEMKFVMEFVKFILVRSPKLKKVTVFSAAEYYRESVIVKTLLGAPRTSPAVIVTLNDFDF